MLRNAIVLLLLIVPSSLLAERPYTGRVISEYVDSVETPEGLYIGPIEDRGSFVVVSDKYVLTNWHVVAGYLFHEQLGEPVKMTLHFSKGKPKTGTVVATDSTNDLALVGFEGGLSKGLHRIGIAEEFDPKVLVLAGYQEGELSKYAEETARSFELVGPSYFTIPVKAIDGQSGSPIINGRGQLCGLLWGSDYPTEELAYGVKVDRIREFLEEEAPDVLKQKGNFLKRFKK